MTEFKDFEKLPIEIERPLLKAINIAYSKGESYICIKYDKDNDNMFFIAGSKEKVLNEKIK